MIPPPTTARPCPQTTITAAIMLPILKSGKRRQSSTDDGVQMIGTKPTLDITYTPDESKLEGGKYTKQDVPASATVKIDGENVNEHTTFVHQDCTTACGWENPATPGTPAFLIHIQTCTLSITKQGGADSESMCLMFSRMVRSIPK